MRTRKLSFFGLVVAGLLAAPVLATISDVAQLKYEEGRAEWSEDLSPLSADDWSYARAAHLLDRAGFSGTPAAIERLAAMTPQEAVDFLVDYESLRNDAVGAFQESGIWDEGMLPDLDENLGEDFVPSLERFYERGQVYGVKAREVGVRPLQPVIDKIYYRKFATRHEWERGMIWWADRMLRTSRPLEERMTLFWHDHFPVEQEKLRDYRFVVDYVDLLREHATGNFRELLIEVSKSAAMSVYLDNRLNIKGQPNENFAREIMELFALGVGNYTETDIKEAARAFTGWSHYGLRFVDLPDLHDTGEKTVLGETGNFDGEDIVDVLLRQEVCAEFISGKIYRYLVREDLSPELNRRLAAVLRDNDYELKPLLRTILRSRDFYSPRSYGTRIKSPVDLLVSTYAKLGLEQFPGTPYFPWVSASLGQALGNPPNVAGWDDGRGWINPSTLVERGNVARHILFPVEARGQYEHGPFADRYGKYLKHGRTVFSRDFDFIYGSVEELQSEGDSMGGMQSKMMAPATKMINETPTYDLAYGVFNGKSRAYENVIPPDQSPARFSFVRMLQEADVSTVEDAVAYLERLLLRVPLKEGARSSLVAFLAERSSASELDFADAATENHLREVAHVIMSSPEYQLS